MIRHAFILLNSRRSMPNLIDSSKANRLTGVILLVFSLFLFSLPDIVIKFFSDQYSVLQIVFIRGVITSALMYLAACFYTTRNQLMPYRPQLTILAVYVASPLILPATLERSPKS